MSQDASLALQSQIKVAIEEKTALSIRGGNSKHFYGNPVTANTLDTSNHRGIINYQPSELVITARAGTPLAEIEAELSKNQQYLPFDPPHFGSNATLGGTIACGLSGSARPFSGSVRDAVLGCRILNGHAEILRFGGEVVKNVAGYDASRLMTGSLGTLGLLLDVSVKVLPAAPKKMTFIQEMAAENVTEAMNKLRRSTLPLSSVAFIHNQLYIRVAGTEISLASAKTHLGPQTFDNDAPFWISLKEQTHDFFRDKKNLWQLLVPPATHDPELAQSALIDWAGGVYWFHSDKPCTEIQALAKKLNGHAILFRRNESNTDKCFPTPNPDLLTLKKNIKRAFDPHNIFNPGKMYSTI